MTPNRILAENKLDNTKHVLQSIVNVDKLSMNRYIYIVERLVGDPESDGKYVSHTPLTKSNSYIVGAYRLKKDVELSKGKILYAVVDSDNKKISLEYTQQDCLVSAMKHFCETNGLCIISNL